MKRKRRKGGEIFGDGKNIFAEEKKTEEENIMEKEKIVEDRRVEHRRLYNRSLRPKKDKV